MRVKREGGRESGQRTGGTLVAGAGDDVGRLLVGHVKDGERVLVVAVADLALVVALVGPAVDDALGVVDVAVAAGAAGGAGLGGVLEVDEDEARVAPFVAGHGADGDGVLLLLVDDDVVRGADGQAVEVARQVVLREGDGRGRVDVEQLLPVEDLHAVLARLGADDDVVLVAADLAPDGL